jgi:hypothetical protein
MSLADGSPELEAFESGALRDFYDPSDFSDGEVAFELERVYKETQIERDWIAEAGLRPYSDRYRLMVAERAGQLQAVDSSDDFRLIRRLATRSPEYSLPLLRGRALHVLQFIAASWGIEEGADGQDNWALSVTSLARDTQYQARISASERKVAVKPKGGSDSIHSSHEYGLAFDLDASGLYRNAGNGWEAVHPRVEHDFDGKIDQSRMTLRGILRGLEQQTYVNVCEELAGTKQWVFHVCVNPLTPAPELLFNLRIPRRA